jgi:hypothetical protein
MLSQAAPAIIGITFVDWLAHAFTLAFSVLPGSLKNADHQKGPASFLRKSVTSTDLYVKVATHALPQSDVSVSSHLVVPSHRGASKRSLRMGLAYVIHGPTSDDCTTSQITSAHQ